MRQGRAEIEDIENAASIDCKGHCARHIFWKFVVFKIPDHRLCIEEAELPFSRSRPAAVGPQEKVLVVDRQSVVKAVSQCANAFRSSRRFSPDFVEDRKLFHIVYLSAQKHYDMWCASASPSSPLWRNSSFNR